MAGGQVRATAQVDDAGEVQSIALTNTSDRPYRLYIPGIERTMRAIPPDQGVTFTLNGRERRIMSNVAEGGVSFEMRSD